MQLCFVRKVCCSLGYAMRCNHNRSKSCQFTSRFGFDAIVATQFQSGHSRWSSLHFALFPLPFVIRCHTNWWTRHLFNVYTKCVHFMRSAQHRWHKQNGKLVIQRWMDWILKLAVVSPRFGFWINTTLMHEALHVCLRAHVAHHAQIVITEMFMRNEIRHS